MSTHRAIIIPNIIDDVGVVKIFRLVEENAHRGKELNYELFESILGIILHEVGLLSRKCILDRKIRELAHSTAPSPDLYHLSSDEVEGIVDDVIDLLVESSGQLDQRLSKRLSKAINDLPNEDKVMYDMMDVFYGVPGKESLTILLSKPVNRSEKGWQ